MEFYLLEDLDFHLVVFHPHRALLNMMGREAADGGRWPKTRVEEDRDLRAAEEARTKKAGTANPGGGVGGVMGRGRSSSTASQPAVGASSPGAQNSDGKQEGEESEEARITRLMSRGSMQGLMEVDDSAFQMSSYVHRPTLVLAGKAILTSRFIITDSYRTDVSLLYPPYIIALAAMYIALTFNGVQSANVAAMASNNAAKGLSTGLAVHHKPSNSTQTSSIPEAISTNAALGLPPPPGTKTAASGAPAPAAAAAAGGPMNNNRGGPGGSVPTLGRTSSTASLPAASSQSSASAHTAAPVPGRANPSNRPLPPGVITAAQFISTFNVSLPVLFACVQDLVALYPIWEGFEPHQPGGAIASGLAGAAPGAGTRNAGAGGGTGAGMFNGSLAFSQGQASASAQGIGVGVSVGGAAATMQMRQAQMHAVAQAQAQAQAQAYGNGQNHSQGQGGDAKQKPFTPQEADALVRRMIEEHARDMAHPDNASIAGSSSSHVGAGDEVGMGMGGMKKGQAVATAQIAGKKRRH